MLRGAIIELAQQGEPQPELDSATEGDWVAKTPLTSFGGLRSVIDRFNEVAPAEDALDSAPLVALRDMLVHGRIFTTSPTRPFRVVKLGREADGKVTVETVVLMTDEWFLRQLEFVERAFFAAAKHCPSVRAEDV